MEIDDPRTWSVVWMIQALHFRRLSTFTIICSIFNTVGSLGHAVSQACTASKSGARKRSGIFKMLLAEFAAGTSLGAALLAAGVYAPNIIQAQMVFKSNVMLTVMMGASATSA